MYTGSLYSIIHPPEKYLLSTYKWSTHDPKHFGYILENKINILTKLWEVEYLVC